MSAKFDVNNVPVDPNVSDAVVDESVATVFGSVQNVPVGLWISAALRRDGPSTNSTPFVQSDLLFDLFRMLHW